MKATTRLRAIAVLSSSVFTLAAFGQAGGEPPADPSEPAAVTPRYIENPFDIDVVEVAKGHATVVECLSFVDIGTGTTSEIAQRRARHVFGTGPRRRSTLHFVLFDTPQKDEKGPTSNYTRPALESGYVYSRLYSAETDDGSEAATRNRIDRIQAELRSLKEKLANISDDGNVNIAGQQAQLEEQIADLNREQQVESDWLEQIQTTRIFLTAGSEEPDDPQPQDPDEPRDEDDGEDAEEDETKDDDDDDAPAAARVAPMFRLIISYIIDGGVTSTDMICYVHKAKENLGGKEVFWIDVLLAEGDEARVYSTPTSSDVQTLTPTNASYIRYWVPVDDPTAEPQALHPATKCSAAPPEVIAIFERARLEFIEATGEIAPALSCTSTSVEE